MALTNYGLGLMHDVFFRGDTPPTAFYAMLFSDAVAVTKDTVGISGLTEIPGTDGYTTGGILVPRSSVGFPTLTVDNTADTATVIAAPIEWIPTGTFPTTGNIRYFGLTTGEATVSSRSMIAFLNMGSNLIISPPTILRFAEMAISSSST